MGPSGVDINDSISFDYGDGRLASIELSCSAMMPVEVTVFGEKGYMKLCRPFYCSEKIELCTDDKTTVYDIPVKGGGYCYEIEHVGRCISEGKSQSEIMPQDESLEIMETLDRIRAGWGLVYPCEK
jgi:predicted dehydrogenase